MSVNKLKWLRRCNFLIRYGDKIQYQFQARPASPICSVVKYQQPKSTPYWMPGSAVGKIFPQIFYSYRQISWRFHFKRVVARHSFIFHFPRSSVRKTRNAVKRYSPGTQFECQPGYRLVRQRLSNLFSVSIPKWWAVNFKHSHSLPNYHSWSYSLHSKLLIFTDKRMQFLSTLVWVKLTLRWLMSYTYEAPILDVSRSHTATQHSR
jgi:hypothetical protein